MKSVDKSVRLTNYLIDFSTLFLICLIIVVISPSFLSYGYEFHLIVFLYYFILEVSFGQTLGKLVTKTRVVKKSGRKAHFLNILIRSCLRLIPIDAFSYLFGTERGLHDVLSSTKLSFDKD